MISKFDTRPALFMRASAVAPVPPPPVIVTSGSAWYPIPGTVIFFTFLSELPTNAFEKISARIL